uniref:Glutaredoxin-dependent peroxiredoxin n=1 Tax=Medicago truncatula TaxID=3880 RepID=I3SXA7_MEDTR|nr:unknown [Medicago truncatula]
MAAVGSPLPAPPKSLWEGEADKSAEFPSEGKFIIVGVPGAFTPPCTSQVPGYVANADKFTEKGINDIFVVAVNDIFVVNAWKESIAKGSSVHFLSDSKGEFTKSLGQDFDASGLLGNNRSKRYVAVVENGVIKSLQVEDAPPNITVTAAEKSWGACKFN